jgi:hypothetical protein
MKKLILPLVLLTLSISPLMGATNQEAALTSRIYQTDILIDSGSSFHPVQWSEVKSNSAGIPPFFKKELYRVHEKNMIGAFVLNFFLPGVGSWTMGDQVGALGIEIGFTSGLLIIFAIQKQIPSGGIFVGFMENPGISTIGLISLVLVCGSVVANWVLPFTYGGSWNDSLRDSLGLAMSSPDTSPRYAINDLRIKPDILYFPVIRYPF